MKPEFPPGTPLSLCGGLPPRRDAVAVASPSKDAVRADGGSTPDYSPMPGNIAEPGPRTVQLGTQNYYEALSTSEDRSQIPYYSLAIRTAIQSFNRDRLAFFGRYLYDNDGTVSYAVDQIANYSVPIVPMANTGDQAANEALEAYFSEWCKRCDYTGRFNFAMLQRVASKSIDTDGDLLVIMDESHGFPQVRLIEGWRVNSRLVSQKDVLHIDGVKVDAEGVVEGYYIVDAATVLGSTVVGTKYPDFIDASQAFLLYDPDRVASYRGITPIRRGMNDIRDSKDLKGFEKLAQKIASSLAGVIEGDDVEEEDVWDNDTGTSPADAAGITPDDVRGAGNPPPANATVQENRMSKAQLLGGDIPVMPDGKKLNLLTNDRKGANVIEVIQYLGGCFVSGLGVPPAFFLDTRLTGPTQRGVNGKAQRKFDKRQEMMAAFVEWVWVRVIAWGIANDGLVAPEGWDNPEWQGPAKVSIDDGADATAWREDVASGLMSRRQHYANRNLNWQHETDQGFAEDDYILTKANKLAKAQNVPVTLILARWGYTPPTGQQGGPQNGNNPEDTADTKEAQQENR